MLFRRHCCTGAHYTYFCMYVGGAPLEALNKSQNNRWAGATLGPTHDSGFRPVQLQLTPPPGEQLAP